MSPDPTETERSDCPVSTVQRNGSAFARTLYRSVAASALFVVTISGVAALLAFALTRLPVIPNWHGIVAGIIGVMASTVTLFSLRCMLTFRRIGYLGRAAVCGLSAIFALLWGYVLALDIVWTPPLFGEELVSELTDPHSGDQIFVYRLSGIPDGFIDSRISRRRGWLPLEETLLQVNAPWYRVDSDKDGLILRFGILGEKSFRYRQGNLTSIDAD